MATRRQRIEARHTKREADEDAKVPAEGAAILAALHAEPGVEEVHQAVKFAAAHQERGNGAVRAITIELKRLERVSLHPKSEWMIQYHLDQYERTIPQVETLIDSLLAEADEDKYDEARVDRLMAGIPPDPEE